MKIHRFTCALAVLAGVSSSGCGSKPDASDDLDGAPEQAAFALSVSDDAASEGSATASDAIDPATAEVTSALDAVQQAIDANVAPELANAREAVRDLNQALRHFMEPIVALVRDTEPSAVVGAVKTWGPVTRGATEFQFILRHGGQHHFGWVLEARPAGSSEAYLKVAAGGITVGYAKRRGVGTLGLDLDALASVDPTIVARGALLARFAHGKAGSIVGYRLRDFTADPQLHAPVSALVQGVHIAGGYNRLRLAYRGNIAETATAAPELVLSRARFKRGVGGRADLLVSGGDVPDGRIWIVSECWNADLGAGFRVVRDCPGDGIGGERCSIVATSGDASACAELVAAPEFAPSDPEAAMSDPSSPEGDVTPPETMPDGTPPSP